MAMVDTMKNKPPPSIGWWPTSQSFGLGWGSLRWWDGKRWRWPCFESDNIATVVKYSSRIDTDKNIKWYPRPDSWPERSKT
jgi:hypothetical protein